MGISVFSRPPGAAGCPFVLFYRLHRKLKSFGFRGAGLSAPSTSALRSSVPPPTPCWGCGRTRTAEGGAARDGRGRLVSAHGRCPRRPPEPALRRCPPPPGCPGPLALPREAGRRGGSETMARRAALLTALGGRPV